MSYNLSPYINPSNNTLGIKALCESLEKGFLCPAIVFDVTYNNNFPIPEAQLSPWSLMDWKAPVSIVTDDNLLRDNTLASIRADKERSFTFGTYLVAADEPIVMKMPLSNHTTYLWMNSKGKYRELAPFAYVAEHEMIHVLDYRTPILVPDREAPRTWKESEYGKLIAKLVTDAQLSTDRYGTTENKFTARNRDYYLDALEVRARLGELVSWSASNIGCIPTNRTEFYALLTCGGFQLPNDETRKLFETKEGRETMQTYGLTLSGAGLLSRQGFESWAQKDVLPTRPPLPQQVCDLRDNIHSLRPDQVPIINSQALLEQYANLLTILGLKNGGRPAMGLDAPSIEGVREFVAHLNRPNANKDQWGKTVAGIDPEYAGQCYVYALECKNKKNVAKIVKDTWPRQVESFLSNDYALHMDRTAAALNRPSHSANQTSHLLLVR